MTLLCKVFRKVLLYCVCVFNFYFPRNYYRLHSVGEANIESMIVNRFPIFQLTFYVSLCNILFTINIEFHFGITRKISLR